MNNGSVQALAAKIRNLFQSATLKKRNSDGTVRVETNYGRTIDNAVEQFHYGFKSKAKSGTVTVLCAGGNMDAVRVLPVESVEGAPKLDDGDVAIYSEGGSCVICRDDGTLELNGTQNGGVIKASELKTQLGYMKNRIDMIINALKNSPTAAQDGGAAYKSGIATVLATIVKTEDFGNIESDKVKHGTGTEAKEGGNNDTGAA